MTMKEYFGEMHEYLTFDEIRKNVAMTLNLMERQQLEAQLEEDRKRFHQLTSRLEVQCMNGATLEELAETGESIEACSEWMKAVRERIQKLSA